MPDRTTRNRIPELDGLRGAAILFVWLGHYFSIPGVGAFRFLNGYWLRLGWTGVDLFFVLSGFLIGGILLDSRGSPNYFKTFYVRRLFRIVPIYYAWFVAYLLLVTVSGTFLRAHLGIVEGVDLPILAQFLFLQNFGDWLSSPLSFFWFTATWSLAVEEQFYLGSPLLIRFLSKRALTVFLSAVILVAPFIRWFIHFHFTSGTSLAYRLMPCRADELAIGMLAALAWRNEAFREWAASDPAVLSGLFGVLFIGVAVIWRWFSDPLYAVCQIVGYSWIALFYAAILLLALLQPSAPIASLARLGFLRDLGGVSYCIYIIHETIFFACHRILLHGLPAVTNAKTGAVTLLAAALTYGIAKLSWKFFEAPMLRRGHQYKY